MGGFGSKYHERSTFKDRGHDTATRNVFNIKQDNNDFVNHAVDEILMPKKRVSAEAEAEAHENIESDIDENDLYHIYNISLYDKK